MFSPAGGKVMLDLSFAMAGGESSPGFTYTPNGDPVLAAPDGIGLGISDDLINDSLAQLTASGILDVTVAFDGGSFDTVHLVPTLPPMVDADLTRTDRLRVLLPDMTATFLAGGNRGDDRGRSTRQIAVAVRPAGDGGSVAIDLGEASFAIDAAGDGVTSSSSFAAAVDLGAHDRDQLDPS